MGFFETFYQSPLQHPWLLWVAAVAGTAWCVSRPGLDPSLRRFGLALGVLSLADAWLSAHHAYGFGVLPGRTSGVPTGYRSDERMSGHQIAKCDLCEDRTADGGAVPRCVGACPCGCFSRTSTC